ncbi:twin-arginine translocase TatA/TatE family subunit [Polycladidibacter stylochi]|uniref:twin-arginine translocase TatA/TatE family subunit n=1 Tax=Polycladidibacter stylochi TaxID=1807766 RepID=UPI00083717D6|nr:twin-arginine translocase TatA/TatE family subunit [Pseudovibrio stylochi]
MGSVGIWQIVIVAVVVVLLFGRGKISELMGDVAKGINSFKKGLKDDEEAAAKDASTKVIDHAPGQNANTETKTEDTTKN